VIIPRVAVVSELTPDGQDLLEDAGGQVDFDCHTLLHRIVPSSSLESTAMGFCYAGTTICYALASGKHLHVTPGRAFRANVPKQDTPVPCSDTPWFYRNLVVLPQYCVWTIPGAFSEQRYRGDWQFEAMPGLHAAPDRQGRYELLRATLTRSPGQVAPGQYTESYWSDDPAVARISDRASCIAESEMTLISLAAKRSDFVITWRDWDSEWHGCCYTLDGKVFLPDTTGSTQQTVTGKDREEVEERLLGKDGVQRILSQWQGG
jgi:hypothetical protein